MYPVRTKNSISINHNPAFVLVDILKHVMSLSGVLGVLAGSLPTNSPDYF
jgi:hypothetical protein